MAGAKAPEGELLDKTGVSFFGQGLSLVLAQFGAQSKARQ
jgi:hypothetical protein